MKQVIEFYNQAVADCPITTSSRASSCPAPASCYDGKGERFAELFESDHRRVWVPLKEIPELRPAGLHRRRRQALLSAQGHRRARPDPRLHLQSRRARPAAGRLDHHPAGRQEPPGRRRRQLRAQAARDDRGVAARHGADQGRDPGGLSQLHLSRPRRLGHRHGGAQLLQEAGLGAQPDRRRHAGRDGQGPGLFQPGPVSGAGARSATPTCSSACRRTRSSNVERGQRAAAHRALREAAARIRLPLPRSPVARGAHAGRHAVADGRILHGALDHQSQAAARHRGSPAGRPRALRGEDAAHRIHRSGGQPRRDACIASTPICAPRRSAAAAPGRCGRSRCRTRGCRSTTCSGRRRS